MKLLSDKRLLAWGTAGGTILTAITMAVAGTFYIDHLRDDATRALSVGADHELRLRDQQKTLADIKAQVIETRTDVRWIRQSMDPDHKAEPTRTAQN